MQAGDVDWSLDWGWGAVATSIWLTGWIVQDGYGVVWMRWVLVLVSA